ncbi:MAG TPA: DUF1549 domain-containing protein, partial [Bryobacteraceae bacterium]|nr:DUF1549 domain-containing protein [Bryobacteraceae bacterium]
MTTRPHVCLLFSALCCATHASAQPADVKAVLAGNCYGCHAAERAMGGLRLDLKASAFGPGDSAQRAIVPGKSSDSELFRRLTSAEKNRRMPLGAKPLAPETIEAIRTWIDGGAPWPDTAGAAAEQTWKKREMVVLDRDRQHWAFRPLARVVPPVTNVHAANPIDRFVLSVLESKGLAYEPEASREKLIRRAQFDLTGLPPSPDEIQQFAADPSAQAYEKLIDRLLASPHYGERWGRHWLDVARYADSEGYERDADQVQMYRYRDWVIRALNSDMPYDKFVSWQVAGDEYEPDNPEAVIATGFLAAGPRVAIAVTDTEENKEQNLYDELDDFVSTTAQATLGLTVGCARCHDHKFDPIP